MWLGARQGKERAERRSTAPGTTEQRLTAQQPRLRGTEPGRSRDGTSDAPITPRVRRNTLRALG